MSASLRAKFDAAVTQLDQLRLDQETSKAAAAGETVNQAALRSDLYGAHREATGAEKNGASLSTA